MFTVCPKCALTLVVTAADLRVAQGYVRCGRCSSVFNALAQLSDERAAARAADSAPAEPEPEPPEPEEPAQAPAAAGGAGDEGPVSEDALEFNPETTDASSVFVAAKPDPEWTAATGSFKSLVAANQEPVTPGPSPGTGTAGDFDVELDAALLSDIVQSEPGPEKPAAAAARREAAAPPVREEPAPAAPSPAPAAPSPASAALAPAARGTGQKRPASLPVTPARSAAVSERPPQPPTDDADIDVEGSAAFEPAEAPRTARSPLLWTMGAVLLALLLVAQVVNHQRDALATDPRFNRPLTALYAALGVPLAPRWDLHAYDVRQLGATVDQGSHGAITVRASIRNAGARPQPLPLLRVTLQDRFGNRLASRDVQPRDYLPRSIPPGALLARDQRIDAELAFVDPGASAEGFELDACLPLAGGGVTCANDAGAR
ncbi:MAG TPA: zinc-ribbon and DUF3426 domain-containing protein [Steroidobacteraceae bacterium]|nr:zinc-ribbon and DUF3426 domain-containing protein [Steroidobacteraceae bacterium]